MPKTDVPNPNDHGPDGRPIHAADAGSPTTPASKTYVVGRNRPPKEHQFKPGQSGHPRGRPKRAKNLTTIAREVLLEAVVITRNGKRLTVTVLEAILRGMAMDAVRGNPRSRQQVFEIAARAGLLGEAAAAGGLPPITPAGEADLADFMARHAPGLLATGNSPAETGAVESDPAGPSGNNPSDEGSGS